MKKGVALFLLVGILLAWFIWNTIARGYASPGDGEGNITRIIIEEGESSQDVAKKLVDAGLIDSALTFLIGAKLDGGIKKIQAGTFYISDNLSPEEIVFLLGQKSGGVEQIKITFPEGWTLERMAERITANDLPGEEFLAIATNPTQDIKNTYAFLGDLPEGATLEGYLFPDTYLFYPTTTAQEIIEKMLSTFDKKMTKQIRMDIESSDHSLHEMITMASIVETEVRSSEDRRLVSGIFWNRIKIGMALQSDATLAYVMDERKVQHNAQDLATDSLYNSYVYTGLPPGPIANPSFDAILAALYPETTNYFYFLSSPSTGQTYFATTHDQHVANKRKVGL